MVTDIDSCEYMAGTQDLEEYRRSGIRAVQSTPLRIPRGPSARNDFDALARTAHAYGGRFQVVRRAGQASGRSDRADSR